MVRIEAVSKIYTEKIIVSDKKAVRTLKLIIKSYKAARERELKKLTALFLPDSLKLDSLVKREAEYKAVFEFDSVAANTLKVTIAHEEKPAH
jgi:hypothetical protein